MMGAPGSPYSRKMRALLRYRRIPYLFMLQNSPEVAKLPAAKVGLLPTFYLPDDSGELRAVTDSTPLIRRFEQAFDGRSVIPRDPALAFVDELLEDYADEWLTKCMFHYRWYHAADIDKARRVLPHWSKVDATDEEIAPFQKMFGERQTGRLHVVGSNDVTAPVIEDSYVRFLRAFDAHLQRTPYLFGQRPSSADFAAYGQLTCLALFDPTPSAVTLRESARIWAWVEAMEDLSGKEVADEDWLDPDAVPETLGGLLEEVGRTHAPFLLANADALAAGAERVETEIAGKPWVQKPFPYQGKCLKWLRESHASLAPEARNRVDALLKGTGCEALFA
jgi:glutathione S-transferase